MNNNVNEKQDNILQVKALTMKFSGLIAVDNLNFDIPRGIIQGLIGPNGAGKTTLFNCITGFYKPTKGIIQVNRKKGKKLRLEKMPVHKIPQKARIVRTFQNIRLFKSMTTLENLLVSQHKTLMRASGYSIAGLLGTRGYYKAEQEAVEKASFWLEKIGLINRANDNADSLAYGDQRKLEIARAMCLEPELLCLDEPAAGLNSKESEKLNQLLLEIKKSFDCTILLTEHDMDVVMNVCDKILVLDHGVKIANNTPSNIKTDKKVISAYLGEELD